MTTDRLSSDTPTPAHLTNGSTPNDAKPAAPAASPSGPQPQTAPRWMISWGPGSSAALSVVCFVLILGAVIGFQHTGTKRAVREEAPKAQAAAQDTPAFTQGDTAGSSPPAVPMPVVARSTTTPPATVDADASLSRARACAAASHWSCVLDAASSVLAIQEGNTEAQSLLQRAIVQGGWATETSSITHQTSSAASAAAAPVSRSHARRHWHTAARIKSSDEDDE
ncbi:hypothetical protein [Paraburkholderia humisilvae]|uniref:Uncharacterized protein n=1 Tax=Paraburkholderia humisilvae TaxID=627669 RepID=A0A6J5D7R4_9BURK|nr:hypothetical protein [Paraburkholderia humisilvae]CAB3748736.1 hypothetical protein LMG29542_00750 [Paraburkholderia humisilvae]